MKKIILSAIIGTIICGSAMAQISEGGLPASFERVIAGEANPFDERYDIQTAPYVDVEGAIIEDEVNDTKGAYRIGLNSFVNFNMQNSGTWMTLPNGDKIWRLGIRSAGAQAITLYFGSEVRIPQGGKLHAYNERHSQYVGAYTSTTPGFQAMEMIQGEVITLEYFMPAASTQLPILEVSEIAHIYRGVESRLSVFTDGYVQNQNRAQSCEVDVACSSITGWEFQRDAVVRYSFVDGGTYVCTGSVINNTNNDCTPYILTANHCGNPTANSDITQHVWYFNYQRPTCSPGNTSAYSGAQSETISGGIFRASSSLGNQQATSGSQVDGSDFVLVEMNSSIPSGYGAYFEGWNTSNTASTSGVGIHHPSGHEKKVSTYNTTLLNATYNGGWSSAHWRVVWSEGVTEGGSSGSPIYNPSGQVVGHLSGGLSACTNGGAGAGTGPNEADLYGKFRNAWDMEGSNANQQLKAWLDPGNTGASSLGGTYAPCAPSAPIANFVANQTLVSPATTVTFTDQSTGTPTSWSWVITPGTGWTYAGGSNANSQNPQVIFNTVGFYDVELTATNGIGSDSELKNNYIEVANSSGPCAASGTTDCSTGNASEYISNVTCESINNSTNCSAYGDYTAMSTSLTKGSSYSVTVTPSVSGSGEGAYNDDEIAVWIDWNDDGDFNDAGEQVGYVFVSGTFDPTFDFTVPTSAASASVIMRCRISYSAVDGAIDPCGTTTWGEVEDYSLVISEPVAIDENDLTDVSIYPNPTSGFITVDLGDVSATVETIELRDITGRIIAVKAVTNSNVTFDLSTEAAGIYFVKVNGVHTTITKKIIRY